MLRALRVEGFDGIAQAHLAAAPCPATQVPRPEAALEASLLGEHKGDDGVPPLPCVGELRDECVFQIVRIGFHFALGDFLDGCPAKAQLANSKTSTFVTHRRTEDPAGHWPEFVQIAGAGLSIKRGARFLVRQLQKYFLRRLVFIKDS